jgi:hypothetical protein
MKLIFAIVLWLANKAISIALLIAVLTVLFATTTILKLIGQDLWSQLSGKDMQEVIHRINRDIKQLEINTNPQFKSKINFLNQDIDLRIKTECNKAILRTELGIIDKKAIHRIRCGY